MPPDLTQRIQRLRRSIDDHRPLMLSSLQQLVEIESPSGHAPGINHIGEILIPFFKEMDFLTRRVPQPTYGDHLYGERISAGSPGRPRLLFFGHMDTVFPLGSAWPFRISEGRAYGPGVSDMKSGLLSLIFALRALADTGDLPVSARILFNSEEEIGSPTSIPLIPELVQGVDYGCILEPAEPDGQVITRRKGIAKFTVNVTGRAAHAGQQPELGIDANRELAHLILTAAELANPTEGTTINAGKIAGGSAAYIISPSAQAEVDARVWNLAELKRIEAAFPRLAETHHVPGTQITLTGHFHRPPMVELPGSERLVAALRQAAGLCELPVTFGGGGAASDGNNLVAAGIPVIDGMGPVGGRAHSPEEYLDLESYFERTLLLATFLLVLGENKIAPQ